MSETRSSNKQSNFIPQGSKIRRNKTQRQQKDGNNKDQRGSK